MGRIKGVVPKPIQIEGIWHPTLNAAADHYGILMTRVYTHAKRHNVSAPDAIREIIAPKLAYKKAVNKFICGTAA